MYSNLACFPDLPDDTLVSRKVAAEALYTDPRTLANWVCNGKYELPVVKVGSRSKYLVGDIRAYIKRNRKSSIVQEPR